MFKIPALAKPSNSAVVSSAVSSYSPNSFGKPAFGWAETYVLAMFESV